MPRLDDLPDLRATLSLLVDRDSYAQVAELLAFPSRRSATAPRMPRSTRSRAPPVRPATGSRLRPARRARREFEHTGAPQDSAERIRRRLGLPVSRRGGALLLAGIIVVVVVVVILLTDAAAAARTRAPVRARPRPRAPAGTTSSSAENDKIRLHDRRESQGHQSDHAHAARTLQQIDRHREVLAEGAQHAIYVAAEHLPPTHGFFYVLWLYNSPSSAQAIGKTTVNSTARMQAGALLPANAGSYRQGCTRETAERPPQPGPTVLSGAFSLNK